MKDFYKEPGERALIPAQPAAAFDSLARVIFSRGINSLKQLHRPPRHKVAESVSVLRSISASGSFQFICCTTCCKRSFFLVFFSFYTKQALLPNQT